MRVAGALVRVAGALVWVAGALVRVAGALVWVTLALVWVVPVGAWTGAVRAVVVLWVVRVVAVLTVFGAVCEAAVCGEELPQPAIATAAAVASSIRFKV